ncbi:uncharacterized protein LOC125087162 [Lutra lutra]|uniref:uncharacterized protein LOC125087162 n=1 Tax=Lutra lutra TaxID=9657 RepID=UPI001FD60806|nr:uncharacterized protein LOC125087162 [Lutra lutra]
MLAQATIELWAGSAQAPGMHSQAAPPHHLPFRPRSSCGPFSGCLEPGPGRVLDMPLSKEGAMPFFQEFPRQGKTWLWCAMVCALKERTGRGLLVWALGSPCWESRRSQYLVRKPWAAISAVRPSQVRFCCSPRRGRQAFFVFQKSYPGFRNREKAVSGSGLLKRSAQRSGHCPESVFSGVSPPCGTCRGPRGRLTSWPVSKRRPHQRVRRASPQLGWPRALGPASQEPLWWLCLSPSRLSSWHCLAPESGVWKYSSPWALSVALSVTCCPTLGIRRTGKKPERDKRGGCWVCGLRLASLLPAFTKSQQWAPGGLSQLSICLRLWSWSWGPGIEPRIGLPVQCGVCFSLSHSPCLCSLSRCLSNK